MRICFIGRDEPDNVADWSGIPYWTVRHLQARGHHVDVFRGEPKLAKRLAAPSRAIAYACGRRLMYRYSTSYTLLTRARIRQILAGRTYDAVFCQDAVTASAVRHACVLYWCDALAEPLYEAYLPGYWSRVVNRGQVRRLEGQALSAARWVLCASDWARDALAARGPQHAQKLIVAPFPVGMAEVPPKAEVFSAIERRRAGPVRLLFVGVDWRRKGGDRALALTAALRARGLDARLTIVGVTPLTPQTKPDFVDQVGFLRKDDPEQMLKMRRLLDEAHFLLLPSRAEAMGIALLEAHAHGVPTVSSNVGGIPTVVEPSANGFAFDFKDPSVVADALVPVLLDPARYVRLARSAREVFDERFSTEQRMTQIEELIRRAGAAEPLG